jgi:hypothetical protein
MDVEVLNKSAIVLLIACWEAYVEDLATNAFDFMMSNCTDHTAFPPKVLTLASDPLRTSEDKRDVWTLAGSGWKQILVKHKEEEIRSLNTPKADKVDGLYYRVFGLKGLSSNWHWSGVTADSARKRLDTLNRLRGDIAHRVSTEQAVTKQLVVSSGDFIGRLAMISSNVVRHYISRQIGKVPWKKSHLR